MTRKWRRASDTPSWSWSTRCKRGTETGRAGNAAGRRSPSKAPVTPSPTEMRSCPAVAELISWGWQPHKLILVCSQVSGTWPYLCWNQGRERSLLLRGESASGVHPQQDHLLLTPGRSAPQSARDVVIHPHPNLLDASKDSAIFSHAKSFSQWLQNL